MLASARASDAPREDTYPRMASEGTRVFIPDNETVWRPATVLSVRDVDDGTRIFSVQCEPLGAHPEDPESSSSTRVTFTRGTCDARDTERCFRRFEDVHVGRFS